MKRIIDLVVSGSALLLLAPLFLVIGVAIKLDTRGPVFFRSVRIGRFGQPFRPFKFRTMVVDAQERSAVVSTPEDDPRITRVGRFLRHYNLDELPQFINVIRGEMSIVGPRPEVPQYVAMFTDEEKVILTVRPGITDLATLWIKDKGKLLAGVSDPEKVYREKIRPHKLRMQLEYVRSNTWWSDLVIMLMTLKTHLLDRLFLRNSPINEAPPQTRRGVNPTEEKAPVVGKRR